MGTIKFKGVTIKSDEEDPVMSHPWRASHLEEPLTHMRLQFYQAVASLGWFITAVVVLITVRHTQIRSYSLCVYTLCVHAC